MAHCFLSEDEKVALRRSRQIDRQLKSEKKSLERGVKILLLGAGECGKSTFVKQMRIIYGQDYSEQDRLNFRDTIYYNILKGCKILLEARRRLGIPLENSANGKYILKLSSYHRGKEEMSDEDFLEYVPGLRSLWADAGFRATLERSNEFHLVSFININK